MADKWAEYQQLVLHELRQHSAELQAIHTDIKQIHIDIAFLKVKSGIWGLIGGAIPVVIAMALKVLE